SQTRRSGSGRPADLDSGDLQGLLARLPVARAKLIRLQRVEHAQDLVDVAADVHVGDRNEADDALRIDDEGRALRDAFLVENAERGAQVLAKVGQHGE